MAHYRLNLLGGFELWSGSGDAVRLPTRKAEALLAYLALAPHGGHARDALTGLMWGDSSDQSARASLRQTLFLIGKAFDRTVLEAEARFVALAPDALDVDVVEFERLVANGELDALERAARLYRGDLLAGSAVNEPAFEEWLTTERERLRERAIDVFSRLVTAHGARGSTDRAIQAALRLVALDSLEESAHRALMRLYANGGRRAAALRQYQSCVAVLQRELATEPAAETQALYRDILQRAAQSEPAPAPARVSEAIAHADTRDAPIGREHELLVLRGALDDASQKRGRVLVVLGDAGIGKTTLFGAFAAEAAARGSRVLLGRSYESEQILPFAPWVDALRSGDLGDVFEGLEPAWRAELTRLLPDAHAPDQPAPSGDQRRLFESIARLLERLAAVQPLAIVLEDLHWADEMSARLLSFLGRRLRDKRVVLAASARAEELDDASALRRALEELRAEP
ncbi:MAG TPA: AAA family ATPase, partial [Thermoanaerobaculia bacterium]|nr:AAA family ATPase [Thermoanaerobaculia bacterium]